MNAKETRSGVNASCRPNHKEFAVIDLFCGVGGLSSGFVQEGFNVVAGIDFDESCKYAYETNNKAKFIHKDLNAATTKEIKSLYPKNARRILVGCAPCQAFSTYSRRYEDSGKWKLLRAFGRIIDEMRPEIVSMENVPQLRKYRRGKVFKEFLSVLNHGGYHTWYEEIDARDYGVPQHRRRLILMASRLGPIEIVSKTHDSGDYTTVKEAIGHLPRIAAGSTSKNDRLHTSRNLSDLNLKRIKATPQGGSWKDWDKKLINECHRRRSGKTYVSVYGRMKWDEPSPTLTTQCTGYGNGRYGHPTQHRGISLREAALLQTFPSKYAFVDENDPLYISWLERHIGNAVPVLLARAIAKSIKMHIRANG